MRVEPVATVRGALRLMAVAWAALALTGCGDGGGGGNAGPGTPAELEWAVEPLYVVGGVDAPADGRAVGRVAGVAFDGDGRLHVLDGDARRVVVIDTLGALITTIGAPGEGPGDLSSANGLAVAGDGSVVVLDAARRMLVVYDPDGTYRSSTAIPESLPLPRGPLALDGAGGVLGTRDDIPEEGTPGPRRLVAHPLGDAGEAEVILSAWRPPVPPYRQLTPEETGGFRVRLPPTVGFHPALHAVPLPGGRLAVVDSVDYRVRIRTVEGTSVREFGLPIPAVPVTEALREAERERRLTRLEAEPPRMMVSDGDGARANAAQEAVLRLERARIAAMAFHDRVPVVARLGVDPEGRIWVERSGPEPGDRGPTDVWTEDGRQVGTLPPEGPRLPDAFGPRGFVAHVSVDAFGAPVVRVGRLVEG